MTAEEVELGSNHFITMAVWDPDLLLNPQAQKYASQLPLKCSGIVRHIKSNGEDCTGVITFDSNIAREIFDGPFWQVDSWYPLTLSPSLLCHCGDHGYIKNGKWVIVP